VPQADVTRKLGTLADGEVDPLGVAPGEVCCGFVAQPVSDAVVATAAVRIRERSEVITVLLGLNVGRLGL
jgi:hypothetical protein